MEICWKVGVLVAAALLLPDKAAANMRVEEATIVNGAAPTVRIAGLDARAIVRVHLFRAFLRWETADPTKMSGWSSVTTQLHAWVDVRSDRDGRVDLAKAVPLAGTYQGRDAYGLAWSGRRVGDPRLANAVVGGLDLSALRDGQSLIVVTQGAAILAQAPVRSIDPSGLKTMELTEGQLNGAYAVPDDGRRHPTLIILHGSEGGSRGAARAMARRFAGHGFAAFALNYFAWDSENLVGVPDTHVNQPIELLQSVRDWLAKQPQADVGRLGVYGASKGAEYATVASTYFPWIKAVAACVPSDSVWQGYGLGDPRNRPDSTAKLPMLASSWSWRGQPMPYIALPTTDDRTTYFNNTAYYEARRAALPEAAEAARIRVDRSKAYFLWLGGGRDETWASAAMARQNDALLRKVGAGRRSETRIYPDAGHAICGDGAYPTRLWANDSGDRRRPDLDAEGHANVDAWQNTLRFFKRRL